MYRSKYHLDSFPTTLPNGAKVVGQFRNNNRIDWRLQCQSCKAEWNTQPTKAASREDSRFCPNCARSIKNRSSDTPLCEVSRSETPFMLARREKRVAKAIATLEAEGYYVRKR